MAKHCQPIKTSAPNHVSTVKTHMDNINITLKTDRNDSLQNDRLLDTLLEMLDGCAILTDEAGNINRIHGDVSPYFTPNTTLKVKLNTIDLVRRELLSPLQSLLREAGKKLQKTCSKTFTFDHGRQVVNIKTRLVTFGEQQFGYLTTFIPVETPININQFAPNDKKLDTNTKELETTNEKLENRSKTACKTIPYGVWITDDKGSYIYCNASFLDLARMVESSLQQYDLPYLLQPADRDIKPTTEHWNHYVKNGKDFDREYQITTAEGSTRFIQAMGHSIRNEKDEITSWIGLNIDITNRKTKQISLQRSQKILKSALDSMTDAVFICDSEGKLIDFNEAFVTFHRFTNKETCINNLDDYFEILNVYKENGEKATIEEWPASLALHGIDKSSAEFTIQRKDTGETWVGSYSFAPILDDHDTITGSVVTVRDITLIKMAEETLARSEKKYRDLIETANSIIICWGRTGIIRFINSFGLRFFGYSAKELIGKHVMTILPKVENNSGRDLESLVKEIAKHPEKYSYVPNENITKNGELVWVAWTNKAIRNDQGELEEILAIGNDITALKQAEKALHAQQELLQGILNSITDAVIAVDMQNDITFINPTAESLSGWSVNQVKGKPVSKIFSIIDEYTGHPIEPITTKVLQKNRSVQIPPGSIMEIRGDKKIYVEGKVSLLLGGDGEAVGMLITLQDVSINKAQKQALLQSESLLQKAGEIAHLGSWVFYMNERSFIWSDEEFRIFGLEPGQITPTYESVYAMLHPDDIEKINESYSRSLKNDTMPYDTEHRIIRPNGEVRHVHVKCEHIREKGKVVRSIGITHDITEYKKVLKNLERSNRELEEFAYVASHDLQEPLRGITGFLQLLERRYRKQLDDKGLEFIEYSVKAAHRMQSLIRELFNLSQLSSRPAIFVESDLNVILNEVKENLQSLVKKKKAVISSGKLPCLQIDTSMIHSLLQNLLTNAIKYNNSSVPIVTISCRETGNNYQISVADNGIGIDPQFYQRIFTIFQRLHTEQEYSGTGMGLALCKKIIESHNGTIWVKSTPGEGTTFYFTLPKNR